MAIKASRSKCKLQWIPWTDKRDNLTKHLTNYLFTLLTQNRLHTGKEITKQSKFLIYYYYNYHVNGQLPRDTCGKIHIPWEIGTLQCDATLLMKENLSRNWTHEHKTFHMVLWKSYFVTNNKTLSKINSYVLNKIKTEEVIYKFIHRTNPD
jgi:hypothetical protein